METQESKFRVMLQEFLSYTQRYHPMFYTYFNDNYCNRVEQWASCYRVHATVNTNMFLEAFHRVLKVVYLCNKQNRRIDFLLTTLLKISRDKAFERLHKLETGKATHRLCEIHKRHKSAMEIYRQNPSAITTVKEKEKWSIQSQSQPICVYTVEKQLDVCNCRLLCKYCGVCPHMYSCTCLDAVLHYTVCKHIHLVNLSITGCPTGTKTDVSLEDDSPVHNYFSKSVTQSNERPKLSLLKDNLHAMTQEIHTLISQTTDYTALRTAKNHLQATISSLRALRDIDVNNEQTHHSYLVKRKIPPNATRTFSIFVHTSFFSEIPNF